MTSVASTARDLDDALVSDVDAEFLALVCSDDDLLDAEFRAIVASLEPPLRVPPHPPQPHGERRAGTDDAKRRPALRGRAVVVRRSVTGRERSPP